MADDGGSEQDGLAKYRINNSKRNPPPHHLNKSFANVEGNLTVHTRQGMREKASGAKSQQPAFRYTSFHTGGLENPGEIDATAKYAIKPNNAASGSVRKSATLWQSGLLCRRVVLCRKAGVRTQLCEEE